MFGYDDFEEIEESPANVAEFFHPEDRQLALALRDQLRHGEDPYFDVEFRHHCKEGSYKWVRCRGQAIFNSETGRVERVIGLNTDIELKKRAELEREAIETILAAFRRERMELVRRLDAYDEAFVQQTALHPRLKTPVRVIDLAFFIAEHDDHHLARISELIRLFGSEG